MTCPTCQRECKRKGYDRRGNQRYQCRQCSRTFMEPRVKPLGEMYLPIEKAELILKMLLEGNSVSSVSRLLDVHIATILKLLVKAGEKCERIMAQRIRNIEVRDVECDELWAFIGKKQKRVRPDDDQNLGDCYTFVAIERHSKLVLNIAMGKPDQATTDVFIEVYATQPKASFKSPQMASPRTATRSPIPLRIVATSRCSSRFTAQHRKAKRGTAPLKLPPRK